MKKDNKHLYVQFAILLICLALLISISFALFYRNYEYSSNIQSGNASFISSWTFNSATTTGFSNPGDVVSGTLNLQNNSTHPISYDIRFSLSNNTGLENATLVYVDNVLVGNLGYICRQNNNGDNVYKLSSYTLGINDTYSHIIKLEYHIGASGFYQNKHFTLTVSCYGKQLLNTDGVTYVKDWNELRQISNAQAQGRNSGEIIKLSNDITSGTDSDIIYSAPTTIDLNGKTLTLQKNIKFEGAGRSYLTNSRPAYGGISGTGKFIMNTSQGILTIDSGYTSNSNVVAYNAALLETTLTSYIKSKLKNGITDNTNVLGGYIIYNASLSVIADGTTITNGIVSPTRASATTVKQLSISVNSRPNVTIDYQIIGSNDSSALNSILTGPLSYINNLTQFNYDLFLPTALKEKTCKITWWSSNTKVLSHLGIYKKPIINTPVSLYAYITFNGKTYVHEFSLVAAGYSNQDKLTYLCSQYGDVLISTLTQIEYLPTSSTYGNYTNNIDLGITSISYSYDTTAYPFLSLNGNALSVTQTTSTTYVPLTISATFSSGTPITVTETIDITLSLAGGGDVEPIFNMVQSYLPKEATDSDFQLQTTYNNLSYIAINYYVPNSTASDNLPGDMLSAGVEVVNSSDAYNISSVYKDTSNITWLKLDTTKIPPKSTTVYLIVEVALTQDDGNGGTTTSYTRRKMQFVVGGVLHGGATYNTDYEIPAPSLFSALKTLVGVSSSRTYITLSEVSTASYTTLTVNNGAIQSVKGLEYFTKLTTLNLAGSSGTYNTFSDITPLGFLTKLTSINLSYSAVTDVSPLKTCTATPSGGITLNLSYNPNLKDITPIMNLYIGNVSLTGTSCTYQLGAYTIFKWMYTVYGSISSTYNSHYNTSDVATLIQTGSGKEAAAFPLADSYYLPDIIYDTVIVPNNMYSPKTKSYSWSVMTGMGSQYMTVTNPTGATTIAVNSRPTTDTKVVIVLEVAASNQLPNFSIPRSFFITLKGTS